MGGKEEGGGHTHGREVVGVKEGGGGHTHGREVVGVKEGGGGHTHGREVVGGKEGGRRTDPRFNTQCSIITIDIYMYICLSSSCKDHKHTLLL